MVLYQAVSDSPQADLAHTLLRWQEAGLTIAVGTIEDGDSLPKDDERSIGPRGFRNFWQRIIATIGLRDGIRLGGFGGTLPMPSNG